MYSCYRPGCRRAAVEQRESVFVEQGECDEAEESFEGEYTGTLYQCENGHTFIVPIDQVRSDRKKFLSPPLPIFTICENCHRPVQKQKEPHTNVFLHQDGKQNCATIEKDRPHFAFPIRLSKEDFLELTPIVRAQIFLGAIHLGATGIDIPKQCGANHAYYYAFQTAENGYFVTHDEALDDLGEELDWGEDRSAHITPEAWASWWQTYTPIEMPGWWSPVNQNIYQFQKINGGPNRYASTAPAEYSTLRFVGVDFLTGDIVDV